MDPSGKWAGDVKIAGVATELDDREVKRRINEALEGGDPGPYHLFRIDLTEVVVTGVKDNRLEIRWWTPEEGLRSRERT